MPQGREGRVGASCIVASRARRLYCLWVSLWAGSILMLATLRCGSAAVCELLEELAPEL